MACTVDHGPETTPMGPAHWSSTPTPAPRVLLGLQQAVCSDRLQTPGELNWAPNPRASSLSSPHGS